MTGVQTCALPIFAARLGPVLLRITKVPVLVVLQTGTATVDRTRPANPVIEAVAPRGVLAATRVLVDDADVAARLTERYDATHIFVAPTGRVGETSAVTSGTARRIVAFGRLDQEAMLAPLIDARSMVCAAGHADLDIVLCPGRNRRLPDHRSVTVMNDLADTVDNATIAVHVGPVPVTGEQLHVLAGAGALALLPRTAHTVELLAATGFRALMYAADDVAGLADSLFGLLDDDELVCQLTEANAAAARAIDRVAQIRCIGTHVATIASQR